uniref:PIN domain nuclease n=1 Tax=candidate division CPR3 bacterium TaxID=2268181 RepID=A0A7C4R5L8_UNCC3
MELDKRTFAIIIIITTVVSYFIIRKFFKIAPRYLAYAVIGIFLGLIVGITIAWPMSTLLGKFGMIVSPYVLGIILLIFVEAFIIEGRDIVRAIVNKYKF